MIIPDNTIVYIKNELKRLDESGGEIIIELNDTRKKVDVQTLSGDKSSREKIIEDIKKKAANIHHGRVIIKLNGKNVTPIIENVKRERFEEKKKKNS